MYANRNYKTDGKVYYMPNKIFDENFFAVRIYDLLFSCFGWRQQRCKLLVCSKDGKNDIRVTFKDGTKIKA